MCGGRGIGKVWREGTREDMWRETRRDVWREPGKEGGDQGGCVEGVQL